MSCYIANWISCLGMVWIVRVIWRIANSMIGTWFFRSFIITLVIIAYLVTGLCRLGTGFCASIGQRHLVVVFICHLLISLGFLVLWIFHYRHHCAIYYSLICEWHKMPISSDMQFSPSLSFELEKAYRIFDREQVAFQPCSFWY